MDRAELAAWIGVILGIPGILLLTVGREWAVGVLGGLLVLAILWFYLRLNGPPFTVKEITKTLTFRDGSGTDAHLRRNQVSLANSLATEFWIRGISSDGQIENITINGHPPDEDMLELGRHNLCKRFNHPLRAGTKFTLLIEHDLRNSFPGRHREALLHRTDLKTEKICLEVHFHRDRPPRGAKLFLRSGGSERELKPPVINEM